ncbi:50S ribosomal protein 5 alpha, chloroplastic [Rhodamnia argentea]|uniref:50S ribosomal protein 5 alpha, chloroplastic n=1 Tax=Rhodamnia argentea TaxID=178133 RepID=A0A8B8N9J3_9MYRT|nr:50S ribosomal protein 5 alpha, chloroplastic [Rhodamnia argentea]XP_048127869.1 50S ribosomal protein 5 alpha, chloroplastic [Rhodamnia argentea]
MALLYCYSPLVAFSSPPPSPLFSPSSSSSLLLTAKAASRLHIKPIALPPNSFSAISYPNEKRGSLIVRADSNAEGAGPADGGEAPSQNKEEATPVDKLPLESKLQEKAEQKLRMKLAKKMRLRRKRLVRKRRLRKKGRWPPSKMKKLKNV